MTPFRLKFAAGFKAMACLSSSDYGETTVGGPAPLQRLLTFGFIHELKYISPCQKADYLMLNHIVDKALLSIKLHGARVLQRARYGCLAGGTFPTEVALRPSVANQSLPIPDTHFERKQGKPRAGRTDDVYTALFRIFDVPCLVGQTHILPCRSAANIQPQQPNAKRTPYQMLHVGLHFHLLPNQPS